MRADILELLVKQPMNVNRLAETLKVNYRTITHHLDVLTENHLVVAEGPKYGKLYFLSNVFISNQDAFRTILNKKNNTSTTSERSSR